MSLLADVGGVLDARGVAYAMIGAAALAAHGVPRATADIDLLTLEAGCLDEEWWAAVRSDVAPAITTAVDAMVTRLPADSVAL